MTVYTRNQPQDIDDLDISQPILFDNTNAADSVFGFDHYAFSNTTDNQGFHNTVTTPAYSSNFAVPTITITPPTTTTNPILYAFQPIDGAGAATTNLGVLQYSRGPSDAVPSPVTTIQSPSTGFTLANNATSNVFNFSGITTALAILYVGTSTGFVFPVAVPVYFASGTVHGNFGSSDISIRASGTTLQIINLSGGTLTNVTWTLQFLRIQ
jgi:hypothetical protein